MISIILVILALNSFIILPPYLFGIRDYVELPKVLFFTFLVFCGLNVNHFSVGFTLLKQRNTIFILLLLYTFIQAITSILFSVDFGQSLWGQPFRYQGLFTQIALLSFSLSSYVVLHHHDHRSRLIHVITATHLIQIVLLVIQAVYSFEGIQNILSLRVGGTLGNPTFSAAYLILSYPLAHQSLMHRVSKHFKIIWHILLLVALISTQSRVGMIIFIICTAFINRSTITKRTSFYLNFIMYGAALSIVLFVVFSLHRYSSFDNRPAIWGKVISAIQTRPQGYGADNLHHAFQSQLNEGDFDFKKIRVDKAHNELLEVATAGGVASAIVWILLQYFLLVRIRMIEKMTDRNHLTIYWIGYVLLASVSVFNISAYILMHFMIGLIIATPIPTETHENSPSRQHMQHKLHS